MKDLDESRNQEETVADNNPKASHAAADAEADNEDLNNSKAAAEDLNDGKKGKKGKSVHQRVDPQEKDTYTSQKKTEVKKEMEKRQLISNDDVEVERDV